MHALGGPTRRFRFSQTVLSGAPAGQHPLQVAAKLLETHPDRARREFTAMASYTVNQQAVAQARQLIDARQYVLKSVWDDVQPNAADENAYLESNSWEEYAQWHLALTDSASDNIKAKYAFVYGDLRRLHRMV
jgi:hypothetical protein